MLIGLDWKGCEVGADLSQYLAAALMPRALKLFQFYTISSLRSTNHEGQPQRYRYNLPLSVHGFAWHFQPYTRPERAYHTS